MQQKIVITGGPGTGKSTIIEELAKRNFTCMKEISREVILNARKNGSEQLFLTKPLLFSELLLEGRINQYIEA
ncbi:MAG: ATP-binding protein, partial [Lutibacter sp.]|nr:ATP-binding protein [Lutibacter sp.]